MNIAKINLAPLAGVSDNAFRQICRECGAEFTTTEMISAKAVNFRDKKTISLAKIHDSERPCAIQLFGSDAESMSTAAKFIRETFNPDAIDINMGCPVPKIAGSGDGSSLMREPRRAGEIMRAVVSAVDLPVTVKIRAGWDKREQNAPQIAKIAEDSGIAAIAVHGRTREQQYTPPVDLDIIKKVKESVKIPVIGNGDISCAGDAEKMLAYTACDGIMAGRASFGNPWIFAQLAAFFGGREYTPPTAEEKMKLIRRHMQMMSEYKGEKITVFEARKHLSWYIKGGRESAAARNKINAAVDLSEMLRIVQSVVCEDS